MIIQATSWDLTSDPDVSLSVIHSIKCTQQATRLKVTSVVSVCDLDYGNVFINKLKSLVWPLTLHWLILWSFCPTNIYVYLRVKARNVRDLVRMFTSIVARNRPKDIIVVLIFFFCLLCGSHWQYLFRITFFRFTVMFFCKHLFWASFFFFFAFIALTHCKKKKTK